MNPELCARLERLGLPPHGEAVAALGPLLLASVKHKHLWSWPYRTGALLENVLHIVLTDHSEEPVRTLLMINQDWLWFDEPLATPVRTLNLDDASLIELLSEVSRAMEEHSVRAWTWFGPWWTAFRDARSELHGDIEPPAPVVHDHDHDHGHHHE